MEALRFRGKFGFHQLRHEINAQDRAKNPERIGDGISDRRILVLHHFERGLQRRRAGHRSRVETKRVADLDAEDVPQSKGNQQAGETGNQRQQVVFPASAKDAFEKLAAVQNADAIKEHDQAGQADWSDDLGLRREGPYRKADKQDRADPKRKSGDADLADQISQANCQKGRQYRLASDDVPSYVQHGLSSSGSAG